MQLPSNFKPSKQQREAFEVIENTNESVFIYGPAGSGKSSFIEFFRKNTTKSNITLTHTGLAAILIKGQTLHSFFQLPIGTNLKGDKKLKVLNKRKAQIEKLDVLIIDELSSVRCDILNSIDTLLKKYKNSTEPFGGVQMVFIGDFFQISPVPPKSVNEWNAFKNDYKSIWFFDCEGYIDLNPKFIEFTHIHRQTDKNFRNKLMQIRRDIKDSSTLKYFNKRFGIQPPSSSIVLCSTNKKADEYNNSYLEKLSSDPYTYVGESENFKESEMPTDKKLILKERARVMMVSNDIDGRWVNGTFAIISHLSKSKIKIIIPKGKDKYSKEYEVNKETWERYDYRLNNKDSKDNKQKDIFERFVIGSFTQYPIRIARATTIHKSQGQTFNNVLIDFDSGAFAHGQAYVALSRTRTYEGLHLKTKLKETDIKFDNEVTRYYKKCFPQQELFSNDIEEIIPFDDIHDSTDVTIDNDNNESKDNTDSEFTIKKIKHNDSFVTGKFYRTYHGYNFLDSLLIFDNFFEIQNLHSNKKKHFSMFDHFFDRGNKFIYPYLDRQFFRSWDEGSQGYYDNSDIYDEDLLDMINNGVTFQDDDTSQDISSYSLKDDEYPNEDKLRIKIDLYDYGSNKFIGKFEKYNNLDKHDKVIDYQYTKFKKLTLNEHLTFFNFFTDHISNSSLRHDEIYMERSSGKFFKIKHAGNYRHGTFEYYDSNSTKATRYFNDFSEYINVTRFNFDSLLESDNNLLNAIHEETMNTINERLKHYLT